MGDTTKISWTDATFNPWMGCTKVSEACKFCYAERDMDHRYGKVQWGPSGTRVLTSDANWRKPLKWNREAAAEGRRMRVFCASLADVFEDWTGPIVNAKGEKLATFGGGFRPALPGDDFCLATMADVRRRLFELIDATPNLDWLLLTKRPENIHWMWPKRLPEKDATRPAHYKPNVWLGTSVENQERADARVPELLKCRDLCEGTFLSCEPLLGPVDLGGCLYRPYMSASHQAHPIDWVITGGESGLTARPSHPDWFRSLREQCKVAGVPFHHKQNGEWLSHEIDRSGRITPPMAPFTVSTLRRWDGSDFAAIDGNESSEKVFAPGSVLVSKVGKAKAGHLLDGREHLEFPASMEASAS